MSQLEPYIAGGALTRDARRSGRAISRYQTGGQVRVVQVDTETDVALAKVDASTMATASAMAAVTKIAQAQKQLELMAPEVSGRLAYLADDHVLGLGDFLQDLRRDLRRR
jgi:hypothetical protein